jgi:GH15 family glucan-1,4-alpha-glucosidase
MSLVRRLARAAAVLALAVGAASAARAATPLDEFEDLAGWTIATAPGASAEIAHDQGREGLALRIDFDFAGGGFVIARKAFPLDLPPNYAFRLGIRGQSAPNNLEFKLVDPAGDNVWWSVLRGYEFRDEWQTLSIKRARMVYAWGKSGGAPLPRTGFIELAISAQEGGRGSVWIDDLELDERAPSAPDPNALRASASTSLAGHEPEGALDGDPATSWRSGTVANDQWLQLDLGGTHEFGGLVIDWDAEDYATEYAVQVSADGSEWKTLHRSRAGNGGRDYVYLHDAESRLIRVELERSSRGEGYAIRQLTLKPWEFSASPNRFFQSIAAESAPGDWPKYWTGKQTYWTVVGLPGHGEEALLNEEGMLEVARGAYSVEPFLYLDGKLVTWSDVEATPSLEQGVLPIPTVTWSYDGVRLHVTALALEEAGVPAVAARYRIENESFARRDLVLFLALRPFQVLPPWQDLNMVGGASRVASLASEGRVVRVNGERSLISATPPERFGAARFEEDLVGGFLRRGALPASTSAVDDAGQASGAFEYRLTLAPGAKSDVLLVAPFEGDGADLAASAPRISSAWFEARLAEAAAGWRRPLERVTLRLPLDGEALVRTLKTTLAHVLINADGPAIQPGSRTYSRSWIRDGAFTSTALLEMGLTEEVRSFLRWYAGYQLADGRIPCCIDRRGADPTPEHDSNGEFIYEVAEYYRYTRDIGFVRELWPAVVRAAQSIENLRRETLVQENRSGHQRRFFGLLPASISHEGYSSHPVHSYWDDFFALRGLKDAALLARAVGDDARAGSLAALRDSFRQDVYASIATTMEYHGIDYLPASAELGDFDPSSTSIAVSPGGELPNLPREALQRTFERYFADLERRRVGDAGEGYSAYELRNVETLVRMGDRDHALTLLRALHRDRRPAAWNQWQEITWRDRDAPRFIGDMPHTWIGSSFIRALRAMIAYEREEDRTLVLAAGVPLEWALAADGLEVKGLPTYYGTLHYSLRRERPGALRLRVDGDLPLPACRVVAQPPLPGPLRAVTVNGRAVTTFTADGVEITELPADVLLEFEHEEELPASEAGVRPIHFAG